MNRRQQKIRWGERDAGQKLSILMFGMFVLLFACLGVYSLAEGLASNDTSKVIGGGTIMICILPAALRGMKRNAR